MKLLFQNLAISQWWLLAILLMPLSAYSQTSAPSAIKAVLNYNFAKYTQWPDSSVDDEINLCYFNSALHLGFETLTGKTINGKKLVLTHVASVDKVDHCQLIYIDSKDRHKLHRLFIFLNNKPVLTVSDMAGFVDDGGMIEIVNQDNKLRFKINLYQVQQHGLTLSSQLLRLAIDVKQDK